MSSTNSDHHEAVGIIGAGRLGQAMAQTALRSGRAVVLGTDLGYGYIDENRTTSEHRKRTKPRRRMSRVSR